MESTPIINGAHSVEWCQLETLVPYAQNARTHGEEQIKVLASSIERFGFNSPVLIDGAGGIIAGHGRVLAAKYLGLESVPVVRLDHLSPDEKRAYILADNKTAELGGWDDEILAMEIAALEESLTGFDGLGFTENELRKFESIADPETEWPELSQERSTFRNRNFILHKTQADQVEEAVKIAKGKGGFDPELNPNSNGNAIASICSFYIEQAGDGNRKIS